MEHQLLLGVGESVITPKVGCALYGYEPDLFSTSVNDELTATAFLFKQGEVSALLLSLTLCAVNNTVSERLLGEIESRFSISPTSCIIHCTHTHSAPNLMGNAGWGDVDADYLEGVFIPRTLDAIEQALREPVPVKMSVNVGESRVGVNRRQLFIDNTVDFGQCPWGAFDPKMTVISFADLSGRVVANMIHYGCHGTAAGRNREITRDWSGVMTDAVCKLSGAVTAYLNGSEGDVGPRLANGLTTGYDSVSYAIELGEVAAADAKEIYRGLGEYQNADLSVSSGDIRLPLLPRVDREIALREYERYKNMTVNISASKRRYYREVLESYDNGYVEKKYSTVKQNVIRVGDVTFVATPFEPFSDIGLRIAEQSDIPHVLILSNSNGSESYFVTQDQICRGGYEVEAFMTRHIQQYVDNADWYYITETLKQLGEL